MTMRIFTAEQIRAALGVADLIEPVAAAFKAYSRGEASDAISHLYPNGGDVHIKAGYLRGSPIFAVKLATGFTANSARGIPIWDGLVMAFDATTGAPVALLQDGGVLTDWRTAAAGAIATRALAPGAHTLGVIGSGLQAFWQPIAHKAALPGIARVLIWARSHAGAQAIVQRLQVALPGVEIVAASDLEQTVRDCDALVTTTASREVLIRRAWLRAGQHITAIGADDAFKRELEIEVVRDADTVVVDAREISSRYGEVAQALTAGQISLERCIELGELLANPALHQPRGGFTLAKLIGLGVQDLAAVEAALAALDAAQA
jgi:ornithine cyclodeaminase/alanine dehydrogenase-like protein (mu-crystallin family)